MAMPHFFTKYGAESKILDTSTFILALLHCLILLLQSQIPKRVRVGVINKN